MYLIIFFAWVDFILLKFPLLCYGYYSSLDIVAPFFEQTTPRFSYTKTMK